MSTPLTVSTLISHFSNIHYVKTSNRIIIGHISHNPPGKDTLDKLNEEFVVLENEGTEKISLAGWTLTDETATGARRHVYEFPQTVSLSSREKAVVHTGQGDDSFEKGNPPKWNLFWENIASSGTMKETLLRCSTLKGIKWTRSKWSLSKQPSPRLKSRPSSSTLRIDDNKNREVKRIGFRLIVSSCARNLSGPVGVCV